MRQKIERFANGIFTYESPVIEVSEEAIVINAIQGKKHEGFFYVSNSAGTKVRGLVTSPCENISLKAESFEGINNEIAFVFDATHIDAGTEISTVINVVSDFGEASVEIIINVEEASVSTSLGRLSDVFHFTNLAMGNSQEARELFKSDDFRNVVLKNSLNYSNIYRSLVGAPNTSQALEEFLIAARKKKIVDFEIGCSELNYENIEHEFVDKIAIKKNSWGFAQLKCDVDGDFIEAERSLIWSEDFEDEVFWLKFAINPEKMRDGKNYGRIVLSTLADSVVIPVTCVKSVNEGRRLQTKLKRDEYILKFVNNIIAYKLNQIGAAKYAADAENILAILMTMRDETLVERMYGIYIKYLAGDKAKAVELFDELMPEISGNEDVETYAMSMFLEAVLSESQSVVNENLALLRSLYENDGNLKVFLMAIELDDSYKISKKTRLETIMESFYAGNRSSIALVEAAKIIADDPMLFKALGSFEILCLKTIINNGMMNKYLGLQVAYLACREKRTSKILIDILKSIYEQIPEKEMLEPVCIHILMMLNAEEERAADGEKAASLSNTYTRNEIYRWLSLGVSGQLRINGIYERCLQAANAWEEPLPKNLITYFAAGLNLSDRDTAVLYSNIIRFFPKEDMIYKLFRAGMEAFAYNSLTKGAISRELAFLYNEFLDPAKLDERQIQNLPKIMFCHEISTDWKKMTSVAIYHKELREPIMVRAVDGKVLTDIFTDDPVIVLIDDEGNRVIASFKVEVKRLVNRADLAKVMCEKCLDDIRVLLNRLESSSIEENSSNPIALIVKCADYNGVSEQFLLESRLKLIDYYYDNLEGDLLESLLIQVNLNDLSYEKRINMLELMIFRELYSLALKNMEIYGFTGVAPKKLVKLCSTLISLNNSQISTRFFGKICYYCFQRRKYDENILKFLQKNFDGTTQELYEIWTECRELGIDTSDLEERLLRTALFTECDMLFVTDVFTIYYGHCSSGKLVKAYLSYLAYGNLVKEKLLSKEIIDIMKREANYSENDICMLAILKDYSERVSFSENEKNFIETNLKKLVNKDIVLAFYKKFPAEIKIPKEIKDRYIVEYHTDQGKRMRINYRFNDETTNESYIEEDMKNVGFGIFVKDFILFYGENLQYFISEVVEDQTVIVESRSIEIEPEIVSDDTNRYHQLNLIMTAKTMDDEKTAIKLLEGYAMNDYMIKRLFSPIDM